MNHSDFSFYLAAQLLKGAAILGLASLLNSVFCKTSAACRNALWLSAFAALSLAPLSTLATPHWVLLSGNHAGHAGKSGLMINATTESSDLRLAASTLPETTAAWLALS